jgi:hypothetical protein
MKIEVSNSYAKEIQTISTVINSKTSDINEKIKLLEILKNANFKSQPINKSINILYEAYSHPLNDTHHIEEI